MNMDAEPEIRFAGLPDTKFAREYERLRRECEDKLIPDSDPAWVEARLEMDWRCRQNGGIKTNKWTYSWNFHDEVLRRLPTYKPSAAALQGKSSPRIVKVPSWFHAEDYLDIAG